MRAGTVILLLLVCATSSRAAVEHVIQISVDGLRSDLLQTLIEAGEAPNFARFQTEGAGTNNARVDQTPSPPLDLKLVQTLPNHTSIVTSRPIARDNAFGIEVGHGYTGNVVPPPSETVHNFQGADAYKASTFDVAHDHGLRTGLLVSKSKFVLFEQSWSDAGAVDLVPPDDGTDKIDVYVNDPIAADLVGALADEMQTAPMQYVFLHLRDPDSAGHAHDWGSEEYLEAIRTVDAALGDLFTLVENDPTLAGRTALVLTSDHGGGALLPNGHATYDLLLDALIPLYVWGPGVAAGRSLYTLNAGAYFDPGTTAEISLTDPQPPLRNGDTGNLALALLGLPPIPGSFYNTALPVVWNDACAECPADLDADGAIAFADLTQLLAKWGLCPPPCETDLDSSGDIGFEDLTMLLASWGPCPATTDSDGDTVPDCADQCEGQDDLLDSDDDGTPDCLDGCPDDPLKTEPGACGCGVADDDTDGDTVPDCVDLCPGADDLLDSDDDGTPDCLDGCPDDPLKTEPGACGCGVANDDTDGDTVPDCIDLCPGADDLLDTDDDGTPDCLDGCPNDPDKTDPGVCGCGVADDDTDGDTVPDCVDLCPGADDLLDTDDDGTPDCLDGCPNDPLKTDPGICGCGTPDDDTDGDTVPDCVDLCPGADDLLDTDEDGTPDCLDGCPDDPLKTEPGACGCGVADDDTDGDTVPDCVDLCPGADDLLDTDDDGTPDCLDGCPDDPLKTEPGACGCGVADDDTDGDTVPDCVDLCPGADDLLDTDDDGTPDCLDGCPDDPLKTDPGICGCGVADDDTDGDTVPDCVDLCPGADDLLDTDDDGTPDCLDGCPDDPLKTEPGACGCGVADDDTDGDTVPDCVDLCPGADDLLDTDEDGTPDCLDGCPDDPLKTDPGACGCGTPDDDTDGDTVPDCVDLCPGADDLLDTDDDGTPDCLDGCPDDPLKTEPGLCGCDVPETPGCVATEIFSDDFDRCTLDPAWVEVDPNGVASFELMGAGTSDAYIAITVPPGVNYEAWSGNTAARLMQPTSDVDFQLVAKFDSRPSIALQDQGIIVEQDAGNFLRAEFLSPNKFFVATFTDDDPTIVVNDNISSTIAPSGPLWLRVTRTGDLWTVEYSDDGVIWQGSPDTTDFLFDLTVNQVGPHCGSSQDPATAAPGFTALVDYFFNTASPIDPEDDMVVGDEEYTFDVQTVGTGTVTFDPDLPTYVCGTAVTLTAVPEVGWEFTGWTGDVNGIDNPLVLQAMSDLDITANFAAAATAPRIRGIGITPTDDAAVITWSTDLLATSVLHAGKSAAYELPAISYDDYTTSHTAVLMGLEPGTTYHFQILAESEMGDAARTIDLTFTTRPRTETATKTPAKAGTPKRDAGPAAVGQPVKEETRSSAETAEAARGRY